VWLLLLLCGRALHAQDSSDWGVGSTNLDKLQVFWQAAEQSNGPVTVLAFGDSMSVSYRSIATSLFNRLRARLGSAGVGYDGSLATLAGGSRWVEWATANWWTRHCLLPPGGSVSWTNWGGNGTILCDQVRVFWAAQPDGGTFTLSVATNGGPWSQPLAVLDGYAATPTGRSTNVTVARLPYWLRVDGLSGTNVIVASQFQDGSSAGINAGWMARDGVNLNSVFTPSTNVLYPILSALNPRLVVWHMKEIGDIGELTLSNRLHDLEAMWKACVTNGDVIYVGTPYEYRDLSTNYTPRETRLVREAAVRDQRAYADCMSPGVSYQWMVAQGYMNDPYHPNTAGCEYLADIAWRQLGFFALHTDRRVALQPLDGAVCVAWSTATNLTYELECSTNLTDWRILLSMTGDGRRQTYTHSTAGTTNAFFRLSLMPD
jgi:hypothetical protein